MVVVSTDKGPFFLHVLIISALLLSYRLECERIPARGVGTEKDTLQANLYVDSTRF